MNSQPGTALPSVTSRFYETETDLEQMLAMLMEGRSQSNDWRYAHVGDLLFQFFQVAIHLDLRAHIRLWHAGDKLVGYAVLAEDPAFDWQVLPDYEWRGIEDEAIAWAHSFVAELRLHDPQRWGRDMVSGARQDNPQRIAFLERHGFHEGGRFSEVNMLCTLEESIPEGQVPPGCQVRALAEVGEIPMRAEAHRQVWQPWTVGSLSDDDYTTFMRLPGYHRDLDVVAVMPDGVIAAYVNGWIDPINCIGDFGPVGAMPAYRRQGLTRAVLLECLRRMQALGMQRVSVSTGVSNVPAIRLYESVGFRIVNRYLEYIQPAV